MRITNNRNRYRKKKRNEKEQKIQKSRNYSCRVYGMVSIEKVDIRSNCKGALNYKFL